MSRPTHTYARVQIELFTSGIMEPVALAVINANMQDDGVAASVVALGGSRLGRGEGGARASKGVPVPVKVLQIEAGALCNPAALHSPLFKRYPKLRPKRDRGVMLELHCEPAAGKRGAVVAALRRVCKISKDGRMSKDVHNILTAVITKAWWPLAQPYTAAGALGCRVVSTGVLGMKTQFSNDICAAVRDACAEVRCVLTAPRQEWEGEDLAELAEQLEDRSIPVIDRRELFAGFLLHPGHSQDGIGRAAGSTSDAEASTPNPASVGQSTTAAKAASPVPGPGNQEEECWQLRRHPVTNAAESIAFKPPAAKNKDGGAVIVPLLHLMMKMARMGRNDTEIGVGMLFCQLARLRALQHDAAAVNAATDAEIERDASLSDALGRLSESMSSLGFAMPVEGRVPVRFGGLASLILMLEREFNHVVESGRSAVEIGSPIEYMALQDLFPIGTAVTSTSVGGLGSTLVSFRVADAFFEPLRSLFGSRKYSFHVVLETVVAMAGEFVSVKYTQIFEEWTGGRELKRLPIQLLAAADGATRTMLLRRADAIRGLGGAHAYRRHRAGCFFPKVSRGGKSVGGAGSADRLAAPGRLIVDTKRGLELGHAPAAMVDDLGVAIAEHTKRFRQVQRALAATASERQRADRVAASGLKLWRALPDDMALFCWPTAVAFSLTVKSWGFVLVDGLEQIEHSEDAWDQLVLPAKTKEVLLAMAASTQHDPADPPRYRFRDVVDEKGGGVLFLLYGPPGTGKTLSVEALAATFGRPLYSISFAELGSTVAELEERLTDVLALAAHWGALVLLDEGDALVERRTKGQLLLNSMTGVLLRLLESFNGALFITSNRAASFDPAALSRVTLAVRYQPLDADAKRAVWRNALARVLVHEHGAQRTRAEALGVVDARFDLTTLAAFTGSGRAVGAVIRLAAGLCQQRDRDTLTQAALDDAISIWQDFHSDLIDEGAVDTFDAAALPARARAASGAKDAKTRSSFI